MPEVTNPLAQGQTIAGVQVDYERWPETNGLAPIAGAESPPATPPAQATPPAAPTQGEGDQTGTGEGGFNWGLFPDVPEDQREALEPHLGKVQGHVTQLEQQLAGFRPLLDQGVSHEQLMPLVQFDQQLQQDPIGTWIRLAQNMQQEGLLQELDLDSVRQIANGEVVEEGGTGEEGAVEDPRVAQLEAQVAQMQQELQQDQTTRRQAQEDALLNRSLDTMRTQLTEAGVPVPEGDPQSLEVQAFEKFLISNLITQDGDPNAAVQAIKTFRETSLKGFTESRTTTPEPEPEVKGSGPKPKGTRKEKSGNRDGFRNARAGAQQFLDRQAEAEGS